MDSLIYFLILFFKTSVFISRSSTCTRKLIPTHFILFCLFQILENRGYYFSYCMFSVVCTVILWIRLSFVCLAQIVSGTSQTVLFLPQSKVAAWYSSKMLFYWLKIFRHGKSWDKLYFLYGYNHRNRVRSSSVCNMCMGTIMKPLTTLCGAGALKIQKLCHFYFLY